MTDKDCRFGKTEVEYINIHPGTGSSDTMGVELLPLFPRIVPSFKTNVGVSSVTLSFLRWSNLNPDWRLGPRTQSRLIDGRDSKSKE